MRKMLLMKDRNFLYELRACLIYVKVGEKVIPYTTTKLKVRFRGQLVSPKLLENSVSKLDRNS